MNITQTNSPEYIAAEYRKLLLRQSELCSRLEAVADSLPNSFNIQECLYLAHNLVPIVKMAHRFEEQQAYPILRMRADCEWVGSMLERLSNEHIDDEEMADELSIVLRGYVTGNKSIGAETLAWMLRAFFESMRRHLIYEGDLVLPLMVNDTP